MSNTERIILHILSGVLLLGMTIMLNGVSKLEQRLHKIEIHGAQTVRVSLGRLERRLDRLEEE